MGDREVEMIKEQDRVGILYEVDFDKVIKETEFAILFDLGDNTIWVPKSIIDNIDYDDNIITIPLWFAETRRLV